RLCSKLLVPLPIPRCGRAIHCKSELEVRQLPPESGSLRWGDPPCRESTAQPLDIPLDRIDGIGREGRRLVPVDVKHEGEDAIHRKHGEEEERHRRDELRSLALDVSAREPSRMKRELGDRSPELALEMEDRVQDVVPQRSEA